MAGDYVRDQQRHIWVHPDSGKTAKVVRTLVKDSDDIDRLQFSVQRA